MEIKDIQSLATLSRLHCSEEELQSYQKDFQGILKYIDTLKTVEVSDEVLQERLLYSPLTNVVREDDALYTTGEFSEVLLGAAPERHHDYIKVKKII